MRQRQLRLVWGIAIAAGLLRALMVHGLELYSDEAYYWLWTRHPALGYFDHPPMVAWLIRAGSGLPGELGVRLFFFACGALAVVFAGLTARELSDAPAAPALGALLAAASPMLALTGALALPDAPVEAAYGAACWLMARAKGRGWLWAGLAIGLALLSKYTSAFLLFSLLALCLDRDFRAELRTPWPWLAAATAVAIFAPNLWWLAHNDFVSIRFQLAHGYAGGSKFGAARSFFEYLGALFGGAGPVALVAGVAFLVRAKTPATRRVAAAVLAPVAFTLLSALRGRVEANWPALVYPALCGAAGAQLAALAPRPRRALASGWAVLCLGAMAFFAAEVRHPRLLDPASPAVERFHGWRELAARVHALSADPAPFVFAANYQYAGELAFYGGILRLGYAAERPSALGEFGELPRPGEDFLVVTGTSDAGEYARRVEAQAHGPTVPVEIELGGKVIRKLGVTPFRGFVRLGP